MQEIIIGQEAICPDGLGRVVSYSTFADKINRIKVSTYINDRSCEWNANNVKLIDPGTKIKIEESITKPLFDCLSIFKSIPKPKDLRKKEER